MAKKQSSNARVYALSSFYFYFFKQAVIHPYLLLEKKGCLLLYRINLATTVVARNSRDGFFGLKTIFT
jgi:uncharacterized protein YbcC (UPF0753/DUF2309 family)